MKKSHLETFSDGVIAIVITKLVLEMKTTHSEDLAAIQPHCLFFLALNQK